MNIDESVFRMPIYSVQTNYIVMNIDESMFCIPIYSVQGRYNPDLWLDRQMAPVVSITFKINCIPDLTQIMGFQFKYPGLILASDWLTQT